MAVVAAGVHVARRPRRRTARRSPRGAGARPCRRAASGAGRRRRDRRRRRSGRRPRAARGRACRSARRRDAGRAALLEGELGMAVEVAARRHERVELGGGESREERVEGGIFGRDYMSRPKIESRRDADRPSPELDQYVRDLVPARPPVIAEMEAYAKEHDVPIVGPAVATLLEILARSIGAQPRLRDGKRDRLLDGVLRPGRRPRRPGLLHGRQPGQRRARSRLPRAPGALRPRRVRVGDAVASLEATTGYFDVIFIDVDKDGYPAALKAAAPRVRRGGYLLADNVLWSGKVVDAERPRRADRGHPHLQPHALLAPGIPLGDRAAARRRRDRAPGGMTRVAADPDLLPGAGARSPAERPGPLRGRAARLAARRSGRGPRRGAASESRSSRRGCGRTGAALLPGLRRVLFEEEGFRGDSESYDEPSNSSVARVLARRRGMPITLSIVTLEVGRRAGLRLTGVGLPGHFVVGGADLGGRYLDPFDGGTLGEPEELAEPRLARSSARPSRSPTEALRPTRRATILARVLLNLRRSWERRHRWEEALAALDLRRRSSRRAIRSSASAACCCSSAAARRRRSPRSRRTSRSRPARTSSRSGG